MRINRTYTMAGAAWLVLVVVGAVLVWAVISRVGEGVITQPGSPVGEAAPITSPPQSKRTDRPKSPKPSKPRPSASAVRLAARAVRWSVRAGVTVEHAELRSAAAGTDLRRRRSRSWLARSRPKSLVIAEQPARDILTASPAVIPGPGRTTDLAGDRRGRHGRVPWARRSRCRAPSPTAGGRSRSTSAAPRRCGSSSTATTVTVVPACSRSASAAPRGSRSTARTTEVLNRSAGARRRSPPTGPRWRRSCRPTPGCSRTGCGRPD